MARKLTLATSFFFVLFIATAYSARLFNAYVSDGLASTEPTLNILVAPNIIASMPKKVSKSLLPGDMATSSEALIKTRTTPLRKLKGTHYRTLVLNALPKGTIPSSGPSKRTNNLND